MKINNSFLNLFSNSINNNQSYSPRFGLNGANLAPLAYDTISFGEAAKSRKKKVETAPEDATDVKATVTKTSSKRMSHSDRPTLNTSQGIYDEAKFAFSQFKSILRYTFDAPVIDRDSFSYENQVDRALEDNKDEPVLMIVARRKSPNSIIEKMSQKKIRSKIGAKKELNDLLGAKIVVTGAGTEEGDYVLDQLTDAVKKGRLKIKEIKSHNQEDKTLRYATKPKINKLVEAARKNGSPCCTYVDQPRDSGYLAIHIITEDIADGYNAEIQIIGLDVSRFKDLEDLCYKCHAGKNVPKKYKKIQEMFKQVHSDEKLTADFLEYTKRAYAHERTKPIHGKDGYSEFLRIPSDLTIPKELDFNNIAKLKESIDRTEEERIKKAKL